MAPPPGQQTERGPPASPNPRKKQALPGPDSRVDKLCRTPRTATLREAAGSRCARAEPREGEAVGRQAALRFSFSTDEGAGRGGPGAVSAPGVAGRRRPLQASLNLPALPRRPNKPSGHRRAAPPRQKYGSIRSCLSGGPASSLHRDNRHPFCSVPPALSCPRAWTRTSYERPTGAAICNATWIHRRSPTSSCSDGLRPGTAGLPRPSRPDELPYVSKNHFDAPLAHLWGADLAGLWRPLPGGVCRRLLPHPLLRGFASRRRPLLPQLQRSGRHLQAALSNIRRVLF